jgi:hypothetical protein
MGIGGVNISEDVRKHAAAQNLSEEEVRIVEPLN